MIMQDVSERETAGWAGTVSELLDADRDEVVSSLERFVKQRLLLTVSPSQLAAWRGCLVALAAALRGVVAKSPTTASWGVVLEYELPRERGRRPDVIVITPGSILILEFKGCSSDQPEHLDQVRAYARDLEHYHSTTRGRPTVPILALTN
jgi:hypothetical protein